MRKIVVAITTEMIKEMLLLPPDLEVTALHIDTRWETHDPDTLLLKIVGDSLDEVPEGTMSPKGTIEYNRDADGTISFKRIVKI